MSGEGLSAGEVFRLLKLQGSVAGVGAALGDLIRENTNLREALDLAKAVLDQGGNSQTRLAANGPTVGEVIDRVLGTGDLSPR